MQTTTTPTLNIDFDLLRAQKSELISLQGSSSLTFSQSEALEGIINLLDAIQDNAVDNEGLLPSQVYNCYLTDEYKAGAKVHVSQLVPGKTYFNTNNPKVIIFARHTNKKESKYLNAVDTTGGISVCDYFYEAIPRTEDIAA